MQIITSVSSLLEFSCTIAVQSLSPQQFASQRGYQWSVRGQVTNEVKRGYQCVCWTRDITVFTDRQHGGVPSHVVNISTAQAEFKTSIYKNSPLGKMETKRPKRRVVQPCLVGSRCLAFVPKIHNRSFTRERPFVFLHFNKTNGLKVKVWLLRNSTKNNTGVLIV